MEEIFNLKAISPIDGRYALETKKLSEYFSEYAYIKYRVQVELDWLKNLVQNKEILNEENIEDFIKVIDKIKDSFDEWEALKIKALEKITNHDVKAIEYYIKDKLKDYSFEKYSYLIHFGCTSEDINNLAIGKMIKDLLENVYLKRVEEFLELLKNKKEEFQDITMLSHTHGQPATPTTVSKEFAVYIYRMQSILDMIKTIKLKGKFSGAVGNFAGVFEAYPNLDWFKISREFVENEGLEFNPLTTQIESHDMEVVLFGLIKNLNNILYDFNQDMWLYISNKYFKLKVINNEVGSSVMPHKVNPINFENSMANCKMSNSIIDVLVDNLEISRMQRDLSDSSMQRNIGSLFAYSMISFSQSIKGLERVDVNKEELEEELKNNPEVIAEAIQLVLRKNKDTQAYEKLKEFTRGKKVTINDLHDFINTLEIDENDKKRLLDLKQENYIGYSKMLSNLV